MLAASRCRADSLPDPAHSAKALRDVLRRCAKAMSIRSKTCLRNSSSVGHGDDVVPVDAHQPGIDPRDGPEHRRRHHAQAADVAEEPDLGAGHAVVLAAGFGGQPLGDLGLHHHHHRPDRRELGRAGAAVPGRRRCTAGWRPARWARPPGRRGCTVRMSRLSTVSRWISLCEWSATVSGSCRASTGSISTAVTWVPRSSSASVSEPRPGPTSRTWSWRCTPDADTTRRTVFASCTKFCPKDLRGRKSSSFARCRISVRPSSRMVRMPPI